MKKKLKAFTLIELIIVMAIISILMVGIMRLFEPVTTIYNTVSVVSAQRATEQGIADYIGENLRYATSVGIYSGMSYDQALKKYKDAKFTDADGKLLADEDIEVMVISREKGFQTGEDGSGKKSGKMFYGRVIRKVSGQKSFSTSNLKADGSTGAYVAMGESYYGNADYYIRIASADESAIKLVINSDYYNNASKLSSDLFRRNDSEGNSTVLSISPVNLSGLDTKDADNPVKYGIDTDYDDSIGTFSGPAKDIYIIFSYK